MCADVLSRVILSGFFEGMSIDSFWQFFDKIKKSSNFEDEIKLKFRLKK